jgi:hypothetical protein
MENSSTVKIRITHRDTGLPAVGYTIDIMEKVFGREEDQTTNANGEIKPFALDENDFIYVDIFVRDANGDMVMSADSQYPIVVPETVINIQV